MFEFNYDFIHDIVSMVSVQGKPCWYRDFYIRENGINPIKDIGPYLIHLKKDYPDVRYYCRKDATISDSGFYQWELLIYRYEFQKEVHKLPRYKKYKTFNKNLALWAVQGLLYGYSADSIQKRYDENKAKFGETFI